MLFLLGCTLYRGYPMLPVVVPGVEDLNLTGVAHVSDGRLVFSAEGDGRFLYSPGRTVVAKDLLSALDFAPLTDERPCGVGVAGPNLCVRTDWHGSMNLLPSRVFWLGETPFNISDLASMVGDEGPALLAITEYSTVGRKTGARRDYLVRSRQKTERLAKLIWTADGWVEQDDAEIKKLQSILSDWGRSSCGDDLLVEGLAWNPVDGEVFVGVSRCNGPTMMVLSYGLARAWLGHNPTLNIQKVEVSGGQGPEERITGLSWNQTLWAVTAWDSYGYETEPVYGGRLLKLKGSELIPVREDFVDRPSGLWAWSKRGTGRDSQLGGAMITFNNGNATDKTRPDLTLIRGGAQLDPAQPYASLLGVAPLKDPLELGLNGFDFEWYSRDHRLSQWEIALARRNGQHPGAWTRILGGLWQMTVGASLGKIANHLPGRPDFMGHNRQAVALTDLKNTGASLRRYRAALAVMPVDREVQDPSVGNILARRAAFTVRANLPVPPGAGIILQGFSIDTSARANRGICVAALDIGTDILNNEVILHALIVGGLCNDFDLRGPSLRHGRTTSFEGAVEVTLDFAIVEGVESHAWSMEMAEPTVPLHQTDRWARSYLHCSQIPSPAPQLSGSPDLPSAVLRGFAFAFDPLGFTPSPESEDPTQGDILRRNNYLYRYLLRAFGGSPPLVEGGFSHGLHQRGPMKDAALPSALYLRADMTGIGVQAPVYDIPRQAPDPNLLPEDGFIRWAVTTPQKGPPQCSPPSR